MALNELPTTQRPAVQEALSRWSDDARLDPLPGECDWNFRVSGTVSGVLKISGDIHDREQIEMQIAILDYLAGTGDVPTPRVIPSRNGNEIERIDDDGELRYARMVSLLPGRMFVELTQVDAGLLRDIGITLGRLHVALAQFVHPGLDRQLKWDLCAADAFESGVGKVEGAARRALLRRVFSHYKDSNQPILRSLPRQALHNDLNDHNVLVVTGPEGDGRLSGVIDFGDAMYGPRLADVAIAAAYLVLNCNNPLDRLESFLGGYSAVCELVDAEFDILWPLLLTRLAVSVTNAALMKQQKPEDPYVTVTEAGAWRLLERIDTYDAAAIVTRLRRVVQQSAGDRAGPGNATLRQN